MNSIADSFTEILANQQARFATYEFKCTTCGEPQRREGECVLCRDARIDRLDAAREALAETRASLPPRFAWAQFSAAELFTRVKRADAIDAAKLAAKSAGKRNIVFIGKTSTGKTSLAVATLLVRAETMGCPGLFMPARTLAAARRNARLGHEAAEVDAAKSAPILLLDDLGIEPLIETSAVREVIAQRHDDERPMIVTTGFDVDGIAKRYDDGIARRIFEAAIVINVGGK